MKPRSNGGRSPLAKDDGKGPFRTILALRAVRDLPDTINGTRISQTAKHVLTDLIGRANSHGVSWASAEALAADVSLSRKPVERAVKLLERARLVSIVHGTQHQSNVYTVDHLNLVKLATTASDGSERPNGGSSDGSRGNPDGSRGNPDGSERPNQMGQSDPLSNPTSNKQEVIHVSNKAGVPLPCFNVDIDPVEPEKDEELVREKVESPQATETPISTADSTVNAPRPPDSCVKLSGMNHTIPSAFQLHKRTLSVALDADSDEAKQGTLESRKARIRNMAIQAKEQGDLAGAIKLLQSIQPGH
jgi:hypothetical protein